MNYQADNVSVQYFNDDAYEAALLLAADQTLLMLSAI